MHRLLSLLPPFSCSHTLNSQDSSMMTSSLLCSPRIGLPISEILLASSSSGVGLPRMGAQTPWMNKAMSNDSFIFFLNHYNNNKKKIHMCHVHKTWPQKVKHKKQKNKTLHTFWNILKVLCEAFIYTPITVFPVETGC